MPLELELEALLAVHSLSDGGLALGAQAVVAEVSLRAASTRLQACVCNEVEVQAAHTSVSEALTAMYAASDLAMAGLMPWPARSHLVIVFCGLSRRASKMAHQPSLPS